MSSLLLLAAVSLTGCGHRAPPTLASLDAHPRGYWELIQLEPRCRRPTGAEREACNAAAAMLEQDTARATETFLLLWWDTLQSLPDKGLPAPPIGGFDAAEKFAMRLRAQVPNDRAETRERVVVSALRTTFERAPPGIVVTEMREHLDRVSFRSRASWDHFADAYARARRASPECSTSPELFPVECPADALRSLREDLGAEIRRPPRD